MLVILKKKEDRENKKKKTIDHAVSLLMFWYLIPVSFIHILLNN